MDMNKFMMELLQYLIEVGIAALVPVVTHYVLTKISKAKLDKYASLADQVVKCAQETLGAGYGEQKKKLAEDRLSALVKGKLSADQIDTLLRAAVFEMKKDTQAELAKVQDSPAPAAVDSTK